MRRLRNRLPRYGRRPSSEFGVKEPPRYGYSDAGHGGHLGHLQPLPPGGQRWSSQSVVDGTMIRFVSKEATPAGDILTAEDGSLWRPVHRGRGGVEPVE